MTTTTREGECKSKTDEDVIMQKESMYLRALLSSPKMDKGRIKEALLRLMYLEMLGHDASFGHIHAVKACVEPEVAVKRAGYLATTSFLNENHDLIILIVNTVQRDLKSDDYLVVCAALTAITRLVNEDTVPAVLPQVVELLMHPVAHVRKKAIMALARFYQKSPQSVSHLDGKFREMICDKDPSVMSAAVCALHELIQRDPEPHKNLTSSFVSVLKQVIDRRLPKSYEYHRTPAPFVQIKLLKILAILGAHDKATSSEMYAVLEDTLERASTKNQIGNALVYETVRTITSIYPHPQLLAQCALVISRFIKSTNNNLKYVGLNALACIVNVNPSYAAEHQMAVVDCLEDPDETLRKKTLDLLYRMTKPNNVEVIVERMLAFLKRDVDKYSDRYVREEAVSRVAELAERYAPNAKWYINTMTELFSIAGDVVKPSIGQSLMRLISEGTGDASIDDVSRKSAVDAYVKLFDTPKLPLVLLETMVWVLGEFGEMSGRGAEELMDMMVGAIETQSEGSKVETLVLSAIAKIARRTGGGVSQRARELVERNTKSQFIDKQQRASEVAVLVAEGPTLLTQVIAPSAVDIEVDENLSIMNQFVSNALSNGAQPYQDKAQRAAAEAAREEARAREIESKIKANASRGSGPLVFEHHEVSKPPSAPTPQDDLDSFFSGGGAPAASAAPAPVAARTSAPAPAPAPPVVDAAKVQLADALFGGASASKEQSSAPVAFTPPPRGAPTMKAATVSAAPMVDLLSELSAPSGQLAPPASDPFAAMSAPPKPVVPAHDFFSQSDLIAMSPPKAPPPAASPPPADGAPTSLSGGVAKGSDKKDPFADLFK